MCPPTSKKDKIGIPAPQSKTKSNALRTSGDRNASDKRNVVMTEAEAVLLTTAASIFLATPALPAGYLLVETKIAHATSSNNKPTVKYMPITMYRVLPPNVMGISQYFIAKNCAT